jgi:hypothetical protein
MKKKNIIFIITSIILILFLLSISFGTQLKKSSEKTNINTLSKKEIQEGWKLLFDGKTLNGWQLSKPGTWGVEDGAIARVSKGSYIWTENKYGNFILDLEYKVSPNCNSGIFFRVGDLKDPVQTGFEMQVIDPWGSPDQKTKKNSCGSLYDIIGPSSDMSKPVGEWNNAVVTCKDNIISVSLNSVKVLEIDLDKYTTPNMNIDGTKNKFNTALKDFPRTGYIGFQDHGFPVWYRSVKIKNL